MLVRLVDLRGSVIVALVRQVPAWECHWCVDKMGTYLHGSVTGVLVRQVPMWECRWCVGKTGTCVEVSVVCW